MLPLLKRENKFVCCCKGNIKVCFGFSFSVTPVKKFLIILIQLTGFIFDSIPFLYLVKMFTCFVCFSGFNTCSFEVLKYEH
jgi:hypothetical protein